MELDTSVHTARRTERSDHVEPRGRPPRGDRASLLPGRVDPPLPPSTDVVEWDDCSHCGTPADDLQRCESCMSALHCSKRCQKAHWKRAGHTQKCRRARAPFELGGGKSSAAASNGANEARRPNCTGRPRSPLRGSVPSLQVAPGATQHREHRENRACAARSVKWADRRTAIAS